MLSELWQPTTQKSSFLPCKRQNIFKCRKLNSFPRLCKSTRIDFIEDKTVSVKEDPTINLLIGTNQTTIKDEDTSDIYIKNISTTTTNTTVPDEVYVTMKLFGISKSMEFKLDAGAKVNVIPWCVVEYWIPFLNYNHYIITCTDIVGNT